MPPAAKPMAFLSDIHGALAPLEAVLEELARREVSDIYVAGDLLLGGDQPLEVWRKLQSVNARCTRGASDTALCMVDPATLSPTDEHQRLRMERFLNTRRDLGELVLASIRRLPERLRIPMIDGREILMTHESPIGTGAELSHDLDDDELIDLLDSDPADIFVVGSTHVPFQRALTGAHVINVGSVGQAPGGEVAHFTILNPRLDGTEILQDFVT
ncbi:MAG: metallophosphoesterase family protein, partial [Sandaracinaceae bacterium]|nr:metallophosphoesterase family protein [Sandaracinaceae bacterium]